MHNGSFRYGQGYKGEFCNCWHSLNPKDNGGSTPLHNAAEKGHFNICQLLMNRVSDQNPAKNNGKTPLHYAAESGHYEICQLIQC
jgi:ankyrin repeat protein